MPDVAGIEIADEQRDYAAKCIELVMRRMRKRIFSYVETVIENEQRSEAIKLQMRVITASAWDELRLVANGEFEIGRKTHGDNGHSG